MGIPAGDWYINDLLTWTVNTHTVSTGAATDADSPPAFRIYEDETGTAILTGSMALLDSSNTAGFYSEQTTLSAANGFEVGKSYSIYVAATVASVAATQSYNFKIIATPTAALDAAGTRAALGMSSANLDTQLTAIDDFLDTEVNAILTAVDTEVAAIKTKTDFLPSATAGAAGGLFIAGTNAATTVTTSFTTTFTGNLTGSVASVTGAVGSVTGAVGSIASGGIAAASFAAGAINNTAIATDAIGAAELAADAVAEIADQVWDEVLSGHLTAGTTGAALNGAGSAGDPWTTSLPGAYGAGTAGNILGSNLNATVSSRATQTSVDVIDDFVDTEVAAILAAVDTEVAAIKTKTDFLPSATAGAAGGVFIAGTNAATTITTALTTTFTGNLTGSVASVTGAVGSVTGSVGSVATGGITTGSFAAGAINAAAIATNAIDADALATDAVTELQTGLATSAALATVSGFVDTEVAAIKVVTDKLDTALELDGGVYRYTVNALELAPTGGAAPSAAVIADAVWDEVASGHVTAGTFGKLVADIDAKTVNLPADPADASDIAASFSTVNATLATIDGRIDTEVAAIKTKTDFLPSATAGAAGGVFIAGTNAATTITTGLTTTFTGNLTGSVASVTGAVGSVTGSVGSVALDGITSTSLAASAVTEIQTGLATSAALTTAQTSLNTIDARLDTEIPAILAAVDTEIGAIITTQAAHTTAIDALPTNAELATALGTADDAVLAAIAGLNNVSAATIKTQVTDALAVDTYAEPGSGNPLATTTLAAKVNYLYKAWRNKVDQTSSLYSLYADDGTTVHHKAAVSDDGTTFSRAEIVTGP